MPMLLLQAKWNNLLQNGKKLLTIQDKWFIFFYISAAPSVMHLLFPSLPVFTAGIPFFSS